MLRLEREGVCRENKRDCLPLTLGVRDYRYALASPESEKLPICL
jgi:hypothetical protein